MKKSKVKLKAEFMEEAEALFDELWTHVLKHLAACNVADHVLPLKIFFFAMLLEEYKEA